MIRIIIRENVYLSFEDAERERNRLGLRPSIKFHLPAGRSSNFVDINGKEDQIPKRLRWILNVPYGDIQVPFDSLEKGDVVDHGEGVVLISDQLGLEDLLRIIGKPPA